MAFTRLTDSASMKYRRAQYHYRCLHGEYMRLQSRNLRLGPQRHEIRPGEGRLIEPRIQPNARWGVLIGDCIQNLRAALDHAAFQLVSEPTRSTEPDSITFPIFDNPKVFEAWKKKQAWINAIDPQAVSIIDSLQPGGTLSPHEHILWKLYRLSNIDKHRTVHVAALGIGQIASSHPFVIQREDRETGTVVIASTLDAANPNVHLQMTIEVIFIEGADIAQLPVFPTLNQIGKTVSDALNRLRRYMV
jgi:hypothetical protein